jgi:hypothetical protein
MDSNGNYAVAYSSKTNGGNPDVKLKRYDFNDAQLGVERTIAGSSGREDKPSLAMDAFGNMVVAYEVGLIDSDIMIVAKRVSNQGVVEFGENIIAHVPNADSTDPEVALMNPALGEDKGSYVVAYNFKRANGTRGVKVTEVTSEDSFGDQFTFETTGQFNTNPSISINPFDGDFLVSCERGGNIFGRRDRLEQ